ncbi:MAG TPA: DNA mismatch repair protein MutS [Williamwhitmania sp.]|nr:DNA mismatch repair protein MutS [Williamwhitmania sp.]
MKQYVAIKRQHPDAILLFRVGDFYETFGEDAIKASEILGITLTRRANGAAAYVELAGFPHHALDTYLPKLVRAGQRVAICEQLEDPKLTKNIVKRGITELITPGVSFNDSVLERRENNFLASVYIGKSVGGVSFLDISTGEFLLAEGPFEYIDKLLANFNPKEVLVEKAKSADFLEIFGTKYNLFKLDDWIYSPEVGREKLEKQFQVNSLKGFGVDSLTFGLAAGGAILYYLELTQHTQLKHVTSVARIDQEHYVWLDKFTVRNLELFGSVNEGGRTLLGILDKTTTPMGARMLRRWISLPLKDVSPIKERLNAVEHLIQHPEEKGLLQETLRELGDLERIVSRAAVGRVNPRELVQLRLALTLIDPIKEHCKQSGDVSLVKIGDQLNPCVVIRERLQRELVDDPPTLVAKGNVIAQGVNAELDELRSIAFSGKDYLLNLQQREAERTGISSLKVSFNNVFGYYIEVRNTHKEKVPTDWIRKQTLVNAERYITAELKEYEEKILGAEEKILSIEQAVYSDLVLALLDYIAPIQHNAALLARLDCLLSFAEVSVAFGYEKPEIHDGFTLSIKDGRHPVIERMLPPGEEYVANNVDMDTEQQQLIIITGPNMSGKSALLRQTALIVLMAQIGCFVPASSASIGVVDKIFTRVGASDNISMGESTFMVEMHEAASILNNLSDRSLILLDEIGRGTSTYDGISIAWAMAEFIHNHPTARAKTLFATHYHELNEMAEFFPRIKNFNVSVKELDNKVLFIRKLVPGGSAHSFGIHVARMAGMPQSVVHRAEEILIQLEKSHQQKQLEKPVNDIVEKSEGFQLSFFQLEDPVLKRIRDEIIGLDLNNLTPIDAMNKLNEIKKIAGL